MASSSSWDADRYQDLLGRSQHGGRKQRALAAAALSSLIPPPVAEKEVDSSLCTLLVKQWAWGFCSAAKLQETAHAAWVDEQRLLKKYVTFAEGELIGSTTLRLFASLGSWGVHPNNVLRDLKEVLGEPTLLPPPVYLPLHTKITKPQRGKVPVVVMEHPVLLPHEIFSHLYRNDKRKFAEVFWVQATHPAWWSFGELLSSVAILESSTTQWLSNQTGWQTMCPSLCMGTGSR